MLTSVRKILTQDIDLSLTELPTSRIRNYMQLIELDPVNERISMISLQGERNFALHLLLSFPNYTILNSSIIMYSQPFINIYLIFMLCVCVLFFFSFGTEIFLRCVCLSNGENEQELRLCEYVMKQKTNVEIMFFLHLGILLWYSY